MQFKVKAVGYGPGKSTYIVHLPIRLCDDTAVPASLGGATQIGRDILLKVDDVPGVQSLNAGRYYLAFAIGEMFALDDVIDGIKAAIETTTGDTLEEVTP